MQPPGEHEEADREIARAPPEDATNRTAGGLRASSPSAPLRTTLVTPVAPRARRPPSADDVLLFGFLGLIGLGMLLVIVLGMTGHLF